MSKRLLEFIFKKENKSNFFSWLSLIALGIASFLTITLIEQRQDLRQKAAVVAPSGCLAMQINQGVNLNNTLSDQFIWYDKTCRLRSAAMGRNNSTNNKGGVMHQYTYDLENGSSRIVNGSNGTWQGMGYVVSHYDDTAALSLGKTGTFSTPLKGDNHAIQEYKYRINVPGPVDVTINWFFATGRNNPIYAITYDSRPSGQNQNQADSRSPYGDMEWTGSASDPVEYIEWGDRYKFKTVSTPLNFNSRWTYNEPNIVPYAMEKSVSKNAEMGLVQTQTFQQHDGGGYWAYNFWDKTSESQGLDTSLLEPGGKMPASWNWTYQLNQYEIPFQNPVTSKRLAWGLNYGAVGQTNYNAYGDDRQSSGYPFQSYSTYVVLGESSSYSVQQQVSDVEAVQSSTLTASFGSVVTQGPGGVGRSDNVVYQPAGYNQIFGTWELTAAHNQAFFTLTTNNGELTNPIFVIHNFTGLIPHSILVNGKAKVRDIDFMTSYDTTNNKLWITLLGVYANTTDIQISIAANFTPTPTRTPTPTPSPIISSTPTPTVANGKTGDIDGDNQVGILDLSILLSSWNLTNPNNIKADINSDGTVGILDLSILLSNWGL